MRKLECGVEKLMARINSTGVASKQSETHVVCNQMPHNKWLQETRGIAASCFAAWSPRP